MLLHAEAKRLTLPACTETMVQRIVDGFDPLKIILFGSYARGEANRHSDVDLLVVFDSVENKHETTIEILGQLSDMPVAKDVVVATSEDIKEYGDLVGYVFRPALRDGKVLYEQS